jgi:hypothetical protein
VKLALAAVAVVVVVVVVVVVDYPITTTTTTTKRNETMVTAQLAKTAITTRRSEAPPRYSVGTGAPDQ